MLGTIMNLKILLTLTTFSTLWLSAADNHSHDHISKYAGEEKRAIKSLSKTDIDDLQNGRGWGLAKAAELNGVPGPVHLLEMKEKISLTDKQIAKITAIYNEMKKDATALGLKLIEQEKELNKKFETRKIDEKSLEKLLTNIAQTRKELRYVHLSSHLKTPNIITQEQIKLYNKLRGYDSNDPCENVPKGHDPIMWKKHNGCE